MHPRKVRDTLVVTFAREISRPEELWMGMDQDRGGSVQLWSGKLRQFGLTGAPVPSEIREPTFPLCFKKRQVSGTAAHTPVRWSSFRSLSRPWHASSSHAVAEVHKDLVYVVDSHQSDAGELDVEYTYTAIAIIKAKPSM